MSLAKILVAAAISVMEVSASIAQPTEPPSSRFEPPQPPGSKGGTTCQVVNLGQGLDDAAIGIALAVLWEPKLEDGKKSTSLLIAFEMAIPLVDLGCAALGLRLKPSLLAASG
jgi:hypothetical protein